MDVSSVQSERLTLEWTEASFTNTRGGTIWYSIVYSTVEPIDTLEKAVVADVLAGPVEEIAPIDATDLVPGTTYFFNILFIDDNGNQGIFGEGITVQTLSEDDLVPPIPGSYMNFNALQSTSLTLAWEPGSDDVWLDDLYYKVYVSTLNNINSVENSETNGDEVSQWSNQISAVIQGLLPDTTYYFNVLVRDRSGNTNAYNSISGRTLDEDDLEPPLLILGSDLEISDFGTNSLNLSWNKAIDIKTSQQDLVYKVVYSLGDELATVSAALESGLPILDWTKNISQANLTGFPKGETVYFSLLVSDLSGNISIYDPAFVLFEDFEDGIVTGWEIFESEYWQMILDGGGINRVFEVNAPLDSPPGFAVTGKTDWRNIAMRTKVIPGQFSQGGIVIRYIDKDNYYHALLNEDQDKIIFIKVENSSITSLGEKSITINPDTSYELYVGVQGANFTVKVDDVLQLDVTDTTFETGKAGIKNIINLNRFDDVKIQKL